MVRRQETSDYDKLDELVEQVSAQFGYKTYVNGWTRKTYDIYFEDGRLTKSAHVARIESLATTNGEIRYFDDRAEAFALALGEALEQTFEISEAVVIREQSPEQ